MPEYRAYIVGKDGHFIGYEPMVCANDSEATEKAKRLADRGPVELWSGPHMVTRIAQASTEPVVPKCTMAALVPKPQSIRSEAASVGGSPKG